MRERAAAEARTGAEGSEPRPSRRSAWALLSLAIGAIAARLAAGATRRALDEIARVRDAVRSGRLDVRADAARVVPGLRPIVEAVNDAVDAFALPFERATSALARVSSGEPPELIEEPACGAFCRHRDAINALIAFVRLRAEDLRLLVDRASGAAVAPSEGAGRHRDRSSAA